MLNVTLMEAAPCVVRTPSRPSLPRASGKMASAPASPIKPAPPLLENNVGDDTTPPFANGVTDGDKPEDRAEPAILPKPENT